LFNIHATVHKNTCSGTTVQRRAMFGAAAVGLDKLRSVLERASRQ